MFLQLDTLAQDLLFHRFKMDTVDECKEKIEKIEKEFIQNMDEINLTYANFSPQKCYRYEGAK